MTFVQNNKREIEEQYAVEWKVGEYNRLSKEDGDKPESDSIQNQHKINQNHIDYLRKQGECIVSVTVYSDDGYAGGTFNRPGYQKMIRDVESGEINCIIFKDNSRLGRNYPELGRLMEDYFPQKGVRVISVLNNLDSVRDPRGYCSAIVSFSNIVNDDYIRQLSIKIKSTLAMKQERGEFIGNYAPFGYQKDPEDRHRLIVDPEEAPVVQLIFKWYTEGMSVAGIAKRLNALHIMTPGEYKIQKGAKSFITHTKNYPKEKAWATNTVSTILKNEVYIGNLIQGRHKSISYRTKKTVEVKPDKWVVVEGTHEPIISDEQFTIVHERLCRNTRVAPNKQKTYLLSGYIVCGHCGHKMNRGVHNGYARFRCPTRSRAPEKCQCKSVTEQYLYSVILDALQEQIKEHVDAKAVIDRVREAKFHGMGENEYTLALRKVTREKERLDSARFRLYDDYSNGLITKEDYLMFKRRYETQIAEQESHIKEITQSISNLQEVRRQDDEFIEYFESFGNIRALDREIMNHLIDRVVFTDDKTIDIYFRFSDVRQKIFDLAAISAEEMDACGELTHT